MIGSLMSLGGYMLVLFLITVWMCVKIWKRSRLLAIGAFLFWPLSLVAVVLCWGDEDSDIRVPFFLSVLVTGLIAFMVLRTLDKGVDETAWMLSDADIADIRTGDPALATKLEEARAHGLAERDQFGYGGDDGGPESPHRTGERADAVPTSAPREFSAAEVEAQQRAELGMAVQGLSWRFGILDLTPAPASLHLPRDFRFVPRVQVSRVARARGAPLANDVLGWVVHHQVDLTREDAWYVQLRFVPTTARLSPPMRLDDTAADASARALFATLVASQLRTGVSPQEAEWDDARRLAAWHWSGDGGESRYRDHVVAMPLRGGVLEFSVPHLHESHAELGARSARLVALRTTPKAP